MGTAVGAGALHRHGLISWYDGQSFQTTNHQEYAGKQICFSLLWYLPEVDADREFIERVVKTNYGPMRLPTKERALVDYMRHLDIFELSYFVEGLHEYLEEFGPDLLLLVADHYGVRDEMQKWIEEDANYEDYG